MMNCLFKWEGALLRMRVNGLQEFLRRDEPAVSSISPRTHRVLVPCVAFCTDNVAENKQRLSAQEDIQRWPFFNLFFHVVSHVRDYPCSTYVGISIACVTLSSSRDWLEVLHKSGRATHCHRVCTFLCADSAKQIVVYRIVLQSNLWVDLFSVLQELLNHAQWVRHDLTVCKSFKKGFALVSSDTIHNDNTQRRSVSTRFCTVVSLVNNGWRWTHASMHLDKVSCEGFPGPDAHILGMVYRGSPGASRRGLGVRKALREGLLLGEVHQRIVRVRPRMGRGPVSTLSREIQVSFRSAS